MTDHDSSVVEQTMRISARPETVWKYWTDPRRMCEWWGESAELDPRPGGTCRVEMSDGPIMRGEYVELVPYELIVFSFGWEPAHGAPNIAPGSSRVEVTLVADAGDTIMTLRHIDIPEADRGVHRTGWAQFLPLLADSASRASSGNGKP